MREKKAKSFFPKTANHLRSGPFGSLTINNLSRRNQREATFLCLVALHSGYLLRHQYYRLFLAARRGDADDQLIKKRSRSWASTRQLQPLAHTGHSFLLRCKRHIHGGQGSFDLQVSNMYSIVALCLDMPCVQHSFQVCFPISRSLSLSRSFSSSLWSNRITTSPLINIAGVENIKLRTPERLSFRTDANNSDKPHTPLIRYSSNVRLPPLPVQPSNHHIRGHTWRGFQGNGNRATNPEPSERLRHTLTMIDINLTTLPIHSSKVIAE